jgi:acetyl esterase/lipase
MMRKMLFLGFTAGLVATVCRGDEPTAFDRKVDVVYGRKFGTALTMDIFTPRANANGVGIVWAVSGGWHSAHEGIDPKFIAELLKRGYTVFAVVHGSQPRFTIPEIVTDMNRAVRFIRYHAKDYQIDPNQLGMTGASAGGHLSLMQGTAGDTGDKNAKDPVDQTSSRIQAVGCFFPPTDFLNYGKPGEIAIGSGVLKGFKPPFDFLEQDPTTKNFVRITNLDRILEIGRQISPVSHASSDDPPTLIIHGDADLLVPIQQAEVILEKLKSSGVETKLVVKKGGGHGWTDWFKDTATIADWFDDHLKAHKQESSSPTP